MANLVTNGLGDGQGVMTLQQMVLSPLPVVGEVHPVLGKAFPGASRAGSC